MKGVNNFWIGEDGKPKPEIKLGMVIDDYKLNNREEYWFQSFSKIPVEFFALYKLDREETGPGITDKTTSLFRFYKLKGNA